MCTPGARIGAIQRPGRWRAQHARCISTRASTSISVLLRMLEGYDISTVCATLKMPVLAIVGTNDPVVPAEQSRWLQQLPLPRRDHEIAEGGHVPFFEAPELFDRALLEWLGQAPGR